jgi:hypothetical protein
VTDTVAKMGAGERRVLISPERYTDLEADLVIGTAAVGLEKLDELAKHPVFARYRPSTVGPTSRSPSDRPPPWCSPRC